MPLKPFNDIVFVKLDEDEWRDIKKPELIEIPEQYIGGYRKRARSGIVLGAGSKCKQKFVEGERIYFPFLDHRPGIGNIRFVKESEILAKEENV